MAQEWKPPDYAQPNWTAPDYAKPADESINIELRSSEQPEENKPFLRSIWDKITDPIVDIRRQDPRIFETSEQLGKEHPYTIKPLNIGIDMLSQMTSPFDLAMSAATLGSSKLASPAIQAIARPTARAGSGLMMGVGGERLLNAESTPEALAGLAEIGLGGLGVRSLRPRGEIPKLRGGTRLNVEPPKPKIRIRADGIFEDVNTGQLFDQSGNPIKSVEEKVKDILNTVPAKIDEQNAIHTAERARKFSEARSVTTPGVEGYREELGRLAGEHPKVTLDKALELTQKEADDLFDSIRKVITDEPTSIRARGAVEKLMKGEVLQQNELDLIEQYLTVVSEVPGTPKSLTPVSKLRDWYELSRGLMSVDIPFMTSAAFRQASPFFLSRSWFKAYAESMKAFRNEQLYDTIMDTLEKNIIHRKKFIDGKVSTIADEIGLAQSDLKTLTTRDAQIRSILAERIPVYGRMIRANNRSYTAFLNSLRTNVAEQWLKAAGAIDRNGNIIDLVTAKRLANTINELTGHGSLRIRAPLIGRFGKTRPELNLEKHADALSLVFWTPRLMARDARMMNPLNYIATDRVERLKYLEGAIRRAAVWAMFTGIASTTIPGATVGTDPTSSDFGKVRVGDTRADAGSGLLQWIVLSARQALGESTSSSGPPNRGRTRELGSEFAARTREDVLYEFMKYKLHPTLSLALGPLSATKDAPFYVGSETLERLAPIPSGDLIELMNSDPEIAQIILSLVSTPLAMGASTYGPRSFGEPQFKIPGDIKFEGGKIIP